MKKTIARACKIALATGSGMALILGSTMAANATGEASTPTVVPAVETEDGQLDPATYEGRLVVATEEGDIVVNVEPGEAEAFMNRDDGSVDALSPEATEIVESGKVAARGAGCNVWIDAVGGPNIWLEAMSESEHGSMWARVGFALFAVAGVVWAAVFGTGFVGMTHGGLDYACFMSGPYPNGVDAANLPMVVTGAVSWWPLGRSCDWDGGSGAKPVHADPTWHFTGSTLALGTLTVIGLLTWIAGTHKICRPSPETAVPR